MCNKCNYWNSKWNIRWLYYYSRSIESEMYGTGPVYLGRPFRSYSRVIFYRTYMSDVVKPEGWSSGGSAGQE